MDYARLALWLDELTDSVRGRWRLNHQASIGDDYGYFSGSPQDHLLTLLLRPTQPTPCTGLRVEIPINPSNAHSLEPASVTDMTGEESCFISNTTIRLFEGAAMQEVLPPLELASAAGTHP